MFSRSKGGPGQGRWRCPIPCPAREPSTHSISRSSSRQYMTSTMRISKRKHRDAKHSSSTSPPIPFLHIQRSSWPTQGNRSHSFTSSADHGRRVLLLRISSSAFLTRSSPLPLGTCGYNVANGDYAICLYSLQINQTSGAITQKSLLLGSDSSHHIYKYFMPRSMLNIFIPLWLKS